MNNFNHKANNENQQFLKKEFLASALYNLMYDGTVLTNMQNNN